jgi:hypothetical protein
MMRLQDLYRIRANSNDPLSINGRIFLQKVPCKDWDILCALPQPRSTDVDDVNPVIKLRPKGALRYPAL